MNLHINKEQFDVLINSKLVGKFLIGSHLYGINNEKSDKDYLIIYHPFKNQLYSAFNNHHQFQYKDLENNIDYNFVDTLTFIRNLVKGDSTINYELLYSKEFQNSSLGFLSDLKEHFRTYTIVKSYLGFADRDARMLNQRKSFDDKLSGLVHIYRSYLFGVNIFNNDFKLELDELKAYKKSLNKVNIEDLKVMRDNIKSFRDDFLNKALEKKEIVRFLDVNIQAEIDNQLTFVLNVNDIDFDLKQIYESNEEPELKY